MHVLSVLDDYSRAILAVRRGPGREHRGHRPGLQEGGAPVGSGRPLPVRQGLGVRLQGLSPRHRAAGRAPQPRQGRDTRSAQGKVEAYHRSLERWFVQELKAQEVVDLEHLQQLLEAMIALLYNRHRHRAIRTTPEKRLAGEISSRRVSAEDLSPRRSSSRPRPGAIPRPARSICPTGAFASRAPLPDTGTTSATTPSLRIVPFS